MAPKLYYHPFASYCQKALIAFYEAGAAFDPVLVDLGDPGSAEAFRRVWPIGKFPVLVDGDRTLFESSAIIEHLAIRHPEASLIPADPDTAVEARMWDRFCDHYVADQVTRIVSDALRPAGARDAVSVEQAKALLGTACGVLDSHMASRRWAAGDRFSLADCAAAPALFYANLVQPFAGTHRAAGDYLERLTRRPSFARAVREAEPYRAIFPLPVDWPAA